MNFGFEIELAQDGEGDFATLYTYRVEGRDLPELDRFIDNPEVQEAPDFGRLMIRLDDMLGTRRGLYHRQADYGEYCWFRDEGDSASALWAPIPVEDREPLRKPYPSLRLYCFRLDALFLPDYLGKGNLPIMVAGYGGVKRVLNPREDPQLDTALKEIKHVMQRLHRRIEEGEVWITEDGFLLEGNLSFEPEIQP